MPELPINENIKAPKVRLVGNDGQQLGILTTKEALLTAQDQGLDLVLRLRLTADPPVCRIADYGKMQYMASKRERKSRQSQKSNELKEIRVRPNISDNDLAVKVRKVQEFIGEGSKVKVTVRFRGREVARKDLGLDVLKRIAERG